MASSTRAERPYRRVVVAAAAIAVAFWWMQSGTRPQDPGAESSPRQGQAGPGAGGERVRPAVATGADASPINRHQDQLRTYLAGAIYPPTSRPLTEAHTDLMRPNRLRVDAAPLPGPYQEVTVLFTADRYWVVADEQVQVRLEVRDGDRLVPVRGLQARATAIETTVGVAAEGLPIAMTRGSDGAYQGAIAPGSLVGGAGMMRFAASFEVGKGLEVERGFNLHVTSPPAVPARFTGALRDRVEDGSLVVAAGVEVASPGHYVIEANLYDADDRPIAWTLVAPDLEPGRTTVDLRFFGKAIRDRGARPPFRLGELRGVKVNLREEPEHEKMPDFAGSHVTRPYALEDFSDQVYDSPDKRARIASYQAMIERRARMQEESSR